MEHLVKTALVDECGDKASCDAIPYDSQCDMVRRDSVSLYCRYSKCLRPVSGQPITHQCTVYTERLRQRCCPFEPLTVSLGWEGGHSFIERLYTKPQLDWRCHPNVETLNGDFEAGLPDSPSSLVAIAMGRLQE